MSTYKYTQKLTPQQRQARAQALAAQRRSIARDKAQAGLYKSPALSPEAKRINDTNIALRSAATVGDLTANVLTGALKSLEGIYDLGAGIVGAVGGIFSEDFRHDVQDHIEYDAIGTWVGNPLDELLGDSYLEDSKAGQITEAIIQGVGQMLPAVAVSLATSGLASSTMASAGTATAAQIAQAASKAGQVAALATTGVSAAGTATEEAFQEGAGYGEGLAYGALSGGVEVATEKLTGGLTKGLYGGGVLDKLGKSVAKESAEGAVKAGAKVGAQRVIKGMVEEGAEEAIAELASPALKSIYKGKDALKEYGEGEYWAGVGESALVGGLTSAVYGGTVGKIRKLGGASGIENDASAVLEDINERKKQARKLAAKGKLTREQAINIEKTIKADMELLEKQLQKASDKSRAKALEGGLGVNFDENGNLRPEIRARLDKNIAAAEDTTYDHRYRSLDLDADTITETLSKKNASAYTGEMDVEQRKNLKELTKTLNSASKKTGGKLKFVIANKIQGDNAYIDTDTNVIVIGADVLKNGDATTEFAKQWIGTAVHEVAHATENSFHGEALNALLKSDIDVYSDAILEYIERGYSRDYLGKDNAKAQKKLLELIKKTEEGQDLTEQEKAVYEEFESESYAFASQAVLGTKKFVRHLVREDLSAVEKILGKISDLKDILKSRADPESRKAAKFVKAAEKLYIDALEEIGAIYQNGKIISLNKDDEDKDKALTIKESKTPIYQTEAKNDTQDFYEKMESLAKEFGIVLSSGQLESNAIKVTKMDSVVKLQSTEFEFDGKTTLKDKVVSFFDSFNNKVETQEIGTVAVVKSSFNDDKGHGLTRNKIISFKAIPDVLRSGRVINVYKPEGKPYIRITLAAPIYIEEEKYYMGVMVQKDKQSNRMYLHDIITEKATSSFTNGANHQIGEGIRDDSHLFITSVLQKALNVNRNIKKSQEKNTDYFLSDEEKSSIKSAINEFLNQPTPEKDTSTAKEKKKQPRQNISSPKPSITKKLESISETVKLARHTKVEASELLKEILNNLSSSENIGKIIGMEKKEAINMIWRELSNSDAKNIENIASDIAEYILARATVSNIEANRVIELYKAWKPHFDELSAEDLKVVARQILEEDVELKNDKESILAEIKNAYKVASEESRDYAKKLFSTTVSQEETKKIKDDIVEKLVSSFDEKIEFSKLGEILAQEESKVIAYEKKYLDAVEKNRISNRILKKVKKLKDFKEGRFVNSSEYKQDVFKASIDKLIKLEQSGNLSPDTTRESIKKIAQWYNPEENPLIDKDHYDNDLHDCLQHISLGEGDLSISELKMLEEVITKLLHMEKNYNKITKDGKRVDALPVAERFAEIMKDSKHAHFGMLRKIFVDKYGRSFWDPMSLVRYMDGYEHGFYTEMLERLREATLASEISEMEIREPLENFYEENKNFLNDIRKKTVKYCGHNIPVGEAMLVYMTLNRNQAIAGLGESGFLCYNGKEEVDVSGFAVGEDPLNFDYKTRIKNIQEELKAQFSKEELKYISIAEKIFNEKCREIKRETDIKRHGVSNVLEDYYVPIARANIANSVDTSSFFNEMLRVSNASFNKDIVKGAKNKLYIESLDKVLDRHIRAIAKYENLTFVIDDYNVLYNLDISGNKNDPTSIASLGANSNWNKSVDRNIGDRVFNEGNEYFKKLISDIQGISPVKGDGQKFIGSLRRNYAVYQLGLNPKTILTQTSSLAAAGSILDYDCIVKGIAMSTKDEVDIYCPLAKLRNSNHTVTFAQGAMDKISNLGDKMTIGIEKMDRFIITRLFGACQQQIAKDQKLAIGTEENKIEAGKLLKKVILETQQNSMATERSAAMRSGNEFFRTITMFTADSMKVIGRCIDAWGEFIVLTKKINNATDPGIISELKSRRKEVSKKARKSFEALLSTAVIMTLIAQLFKHIYNKDDEDENILVDMLGNALGGLPIYKDIASRFLEGYQFENYAYSAINDLIDSSFDIINIRDGRSGLAALKSLFFATGQFFGIPTRNTYNFVYGLTKRFSPSTAYTWNNRLYKQAYRADLAKAIEKGDERMISTIAGLMLNENIGGIESKAARTELDRLVGAGFDVIPRGISDTITYDGETYELTARQKKAFSDVYEIANDALGDMVKLARYSEASDEVKVSAIKYLYNTYYNLALQDFLGEDLENKNVLFAEAIDIEKLALIIATVRSLEADTDKDGKVISGSRKRKVQAYINSLQLKAAEKFMIMGYLGYKNINGEAQVKAHINTLNLTKQEKSRLLEYSGYSAA